jgi:hypothetical protein
VVGADGNAVLRYYRPYGSAATEEDRHPGQTERRLRFSSGPQNLRAGAFWCACLDRAPRTASGHSAHHLSRLRALDSQASGCHGHGEVTCGAAKPVPTGSAVALRRDSLWPPPVNENGIGAH